MTGRTYLARASTSVFTAFALVVLSACGGGDDSTSPSSPVTSIRYVLGYDFPSTAYPAGVVIVSPPQGRMTISDEGPVRVQLEFAGFPVQQLDGPNSEPKDNPQLRYVLALPQALAPRGCTDAKLTVTSVSGEVSVASFGVCAGQGLGLEA